MSTAAASVYRPRHPERTPLYTCQTRNFCPSCQAKRAALFAEHLAESALADVPHRHVVFTIPKPATTPPPRGPRVEAERAQAGRVAQDLRGRLPAQRRHAWLRCRHGRRGRLAEIDPSICSDL